MESLESLPFFTAWSRNEPLVGKVEEIRKGRKAPGRQTWIPELETARGPVAVNLTRVLEDKFRKAGVRHGDRVTVKYLGQKRSKKSGRMYGAFTVTRRAAR